MYARAIWSGVSPPSGVAVVSARVFRCSSAPASGLSPIRAHTQARRGPCCVSKAKMASRALPGVCCCNPLRLFCRLASSFSFSSGHGSRSNSNVPGFPRRSAPGTPGYKAGDSVNRRHTSTHFPCRMPSRSAATISPSLSGSNLYSSWHRDLNAAHREASHSALHPAGSLIHNNRSRTVSPTINLSKSSASSLCPRNDAIGVVASASNAPSNAWRVF